MRLLMLFGWAWACLGTVDSNSVKIEKVGGMVVLKPSNVPDEIDSILWYFGPDFAAEFIKGKKTFYPNFKGRSELNELTGEFTIRNLTLNDAQNYTPEVNRNHQSPIELTVLESVKKATIQVKRIEKTYTLSCDGTIKDAGTVNYMWSANDVVLPNSSKEITVSTKTCSKFTCTIQNAVSSSTSDATDPCGTSSTTIGLAVGGVLLLLLVVIGIHRIITKEWFFQKGAKFWKADFWKNTKTQAADGNDAHPSENKAMVNK